LIGEPVIADQIPFHIQKNRSGGGDRVANVKIEAGGNGADRYGIVAFDH
jgi:hypothetical protein